VQKKTCCDVTVWEYVKEDMYAHGDLRRRLLGLLILDPILLVLIYRIAHGIYYSPLRPLAWPLVALGRLVFASEIHPAACLGKRLGFAHTVGVVVGGGVRGESDLTLFANVTLGMGSRGAWPILGKHVTVYSGAVVVGPARVGDGCRIGANAFLNADAASNSTIVAVPGALKYGS
jgi:serine O-acetyltransferase